MSVVLLVLEMAALSNYGTVANLVEAKKPSYRQCHTMDPRTWLRDLTPYFIYILFISTVGPLLFGFHLVTLFFKKIMTLR